KEYDAPHPEWAAAFGEWPKTQLDAVNQDRRWITLTPVFSGTDTASKLKIEKDHSVLASGRKTDSETYAVSFTNGLTDAVALRLEALPHDSLPAKGPGRADSGNFVLNEVTARIERADQTNQIAFASARSDAEQAGDAKSGGATYSAASTID